MPRRRYDDDEEGFPDIRQKPGTPSDAFGGAYGPPDSDSESGGAEKQAGPARTQQRRTDGHEAAYRGRAPSPGLPF